MLQFLFLSNDCILFKIYKFWALFLIISAVSVCNIFENISHLIATPNFKLHHERGIHRLHLQFQKLLKFNTRFKYKVVYSSSVKNCESCLIKFASLNFAAAKYVFQKALKLNKMAQLLLMLYWLPFELIT